MINKITIELGEKIFVDKICDNFIKFSDGSTMQYEHEQHCCETNYIVFSALRDTIFEDLRFKILELEEVDEGFRINGNFVPAYSSQNGYYSNDVALLYCDDKGDTIAKIEGFGEIIDD